MVSKIQIDVVATFLLIFGIHKNILLIIKVKIPMFIEWSYESPRSTPGGFINY